MGIAEDLRKNAEFYQGRADKLRADSSESLECRSIEVNEEIATALAQAHAYRKAAALIEPVEARAVPDGWSVVVLRKEFDDGRDPWILDRCTAYGSFSVDTCIDGEDVVLADDHDTWQEAIAAAELNQPTPKTDGEEE